ncbi:MAG: cob(I)yrinic acid a,c-diamide adenosyltransferase [Chloroflexota bacterium]|nr:cob(I)yrinic acid a,c-diamide adenosyltransferase [Chloroflexota bacterium]MDE2945919.1 cob(I)yrinic acid a,c-diamide adenosyltransferase [Chloroflexota bacterium]
MKIYTRTGDKGDTALFGGGRVPKHHLRVEAYGTIDEVNSALGLARAAGGSEGVDEWLKQVQSQLFHLGSDLATPLDAKVDWIERVSADDVAWLENSIDQMTDELEPLSRFILPGGTMAAAHIHLARAICRRAERLMTALHESEDIGQHALPYVNRLSDWLFTLARYENMRAGLAETEWSLR